MFFLNSTITGDGVIIKRTIVFGPRRTGTPVCVGCHLEDENLEQCPKGCRLPVCSRECATAQIHEKECTILAAYGSCEPDSSWSRDLLHSLTSVRCLAIPDSDREVVRCLQANADPHYTKEVDVIKKHLTGNLSLEDEQWMNICCRSLNTNAFETHKRRKVNNIEKEGTLRGLYPLGALLNHDCAPNTRHVYDEDCQMIVQASRFIPQGEEITTSYCSLMWDTASRRLHLAQTKQFACSCDRCKDPTEFGTFLSGLPCPETSCSGVVLCTNPLSPHRSIWSCTECFVNIQPDQVMKLQKIQGLLLMGTDTSNPQSILSFLQLKKVPHNSVVEVQLKLGLCLQLGQIEGYKWEDLSDDQLEFKGKMCKEVLDLLEQLRTGESRIKGIIMFELHSGLCEQLRRLQQDNNNENDENNNSKIKSVKQDIERTFQVVSDIFSKDATAPVKFIKKTKGGNIFENYA